MAPLNTVSIGRGLPVLFLHGGMGLDHQHFRPAVDSLATEFRVIYADLRGQGESPPVDTGADWRIDAWLDDLDETRAALGVESWVVVGHSAGGLIAQAYARRHPERTLGLGLCATAPVFDWGEELFSTLLERASATEREALITLFVNGPGNDDELKRAHLDVLPLYFEKLEPEFSECFRLRTRYRAAASNGFRTAVLPGFDSRPWLPGLQMPCLVIEGADDPFTPDRHTGGVFARLLPRVRRAVLPQCGHFPFLEKPDLFVHELRKWLAAALPVPSP